MNIPEEVAYHQLQEDLHAAQLKMAEQEEEVARLKAELAIRPRDPDARVRELQDELDQYKLIAGGLICLPLCCRWSHSHGPIAAAMKD